MEQGIMEHNVLSFHSIFAFAMGIFWMSVIFFYKFLHKIFFQCKFHFILIIFLIALNRITMVAAVYIDLLLFKASALWADAFYKSKCPSVCPSVCFTVRLFVCSLLRYRLNVFLPQLPDVGCSIFLEIPNP